MTPGQALWLTISCLTYFGLGGWVRGRGARLLLALAWPLGLLFLLGSHVAEDIRKMVNRW